MIRPYRDDDLEQLLEVWHRASLIAHPFLTDEFLARERIAIAEEWLPISETTVVERRGGVAGFIAMIGHEVGGLFVDPEHQRTGIGSALLDANRDAHPYLELDVFEANRGARSFYEAYGFTVVGRHMNELAGHPELRMRLGGGDGS